MPKKRLTCKAKSTSVKDIIRNRKSDGPRLKEVLSVQAGWPKLRVSAWKPLVRDFAKLKDDPRCGDYWYELAHDICNNEIKRRKRLEAKR